MNELEKKIKELKDEANEFVRANTVPGDDSIRASFDHILCKFAQIELEIDKLKMIKEPVRKFKVTLFKSPHLGKTGVLKSEIDYAGCPNGWHTLIIDNKRMMFAGEEVEEIKETT